MKWQDCKAILEDLRCKFEHLTIDLPALPRHSVEALQWRYSNDMWHISAPAQDDSPEGPVTLALTTVFRPDEEEIAPDEYLHRLGTKQEVFLGWQHLWWLTKHQHEYPAFMDLAGSSFRIRFPGVSTYCRGGNPGSEMYNSPDLWIPEASGEHTHWSGRCCRSWRDYGTVIPNRSEIENNHYLAFALKK